MKYGAYIYDPQAPKSFPYRRHWFKTWKVYQAHHYTRHGEPWKCYRGEGEKQAAKNLENKTKGEALAGKLNEAIKDYKTYKFNFGLTKGPDYYYKVLTGYGYGHLVDYQKLLSEVYDVVFTSKETGGVCGGVFRDRVKTGKPTKVNNPIPIPIHKMYSHTVAR